MIYHEILVSYLDYVKARGFHTAHIWACPPVTGDDYIMYAHPPTQKILEREGLCKWYVRMLVEGESCWMQRFLPPTVQYISSNNREYK